MKISQLKKLARQYLFKDIYIIVYNIYIMGFIGVFGHFLYLILWKYIDPQPFEDTMLRVVGIISSAPLLFYHKWPAKLKNNINYYWFKYT